MYARIMLDPDPEFRPVERCAGYLPIEDFSLIGGGATCALVGRDRGVRWLCVPRFDITAVADGRAGQGWEEAQVPDHQRQVARSPNPTVSPNPPPPPGCAST